MGFAPSSSRAARAKRLRRDRDCSLACRGRPPMRSRPPRTHSASRGRTSRRRRLRRAAMRRAIRRPPSPRRSRRRRPKTALPPLAPYKGARTARSARRPAAAKGWPDAFADGRRPALPAAPKKPARDDRPFDPLGVSVGDLRLKPFVEEDLGWSSNPGLLPGPQKGSAFLMSQAGLTLRLRLGEERRSRRVQGRAHRLFRRPFRRRPVRRRSPERPLGPHARAQSRRREPAHGGDDDRGLARDSARTSPSARPALR